MCVCVCVCVCVRVCVLVVRLPQKSFQVLHIVRKLLDKVLMKINNYSLAISVIWKMLVAKMILSRSVQGF